MKKRVVSMILTATLCAGLLAGCGDSPANSSSEPSATGSSQTGEQSSAPEESGTEEGTGTEDETAGDGQWHYTDVDTLENPNVTIALYWDAYNEDGSYNTKNYAYPIGQAIEAFEEKYGGTVTIQAVGWNKGANAIAESLETGDSIDLVFTDTVRSRHPLETVCCPL